MRVFVVSILLLNFVHIVFAIGLASSTGSADTLIYPFTAPHLTIVSLAVVLLGYWIHSDTKSSLLRAVVAMLLAASIITAGYAMSRWPGGNDGPGIGWGVFVGLLSFLNVVAAIALIVFSKANRRGQQSDQPLEKG